MVCKVSLATVVQPPAQISSGGCCGKCNKSCGSTPKVWVIAACEGMFSIFEKDDRQKLNSILQDENKVIPSISEFVEIVEQACDEGKFSQLLLVGSEKDMNWLRPILPAQATRYIIAEVKYPLLTDWFKQTRANDKLSDIIENLLKSD